MAKLTTTTIAGAYASTTELNANFALVEAAMEKCLFLDGTSPNVLSADVDFNSNDVLNAGTVNATNMILNGTVVTATVAEAVDAVDVTFTPTGGSATTIQDALDDDYIRDDTDGTIAGALTVTGAFTSVGIDDNADSTALTLAATTLDATFTGDITVDGGNITVNNVPSGTSQQFIGTGNGKFAFGVAGDNTILSAVNTTAAGSRMLFKTDDAGGSSVTALSLEADQSATFAGDVTVTGDVGAATGTFTGEVTGTGFTGTLDGVLGGGTAAAATVTDLTVSGDITVDSIVQPKVKIVNIGTWDMDTDAVKSTAHGLTFSTIRCCEVFILEDGDASLYGFLTGFGGAISGAITVNSTNVVMTRPVGSNFDNAGFNDATNRGYIKLTYV